MNKIEALLITVAAMTFLAFMGMSLHACEQHKEQDEKTRRVCIEKAKTTHELSICARLKD